MRSQRRVTKILDAAIHVFAERGYGATTTTAIADRAEVSVGSLYQFYPNKEAILHALSARFDADFLAWLEGALAEHDRAASIEAWVDVFFEALAAMNASHPGLFRVLAHTYSSPEFTLDERHFNRRVMRIIASLLAQRAPHLPAARLDIIAAVCVEVTHSLVHLASAEDSSSSDVLHEARQVLRGYLSSALTEAP